MYLPRWHRGAPMALDFAVTSGLRSDSLTLSAVDGQSAATRYEDTKNEYLDTRRHCLSEGVGFTPMVVEACGGGWGPAANDFWWKLAKTTALATGERPAVVEGHLRQALGVTLHRENARAILKRRPVAS